MKDQNRNAYEEDQLTHGMTKSIFLTIFGDTPVLRTMDFLAVHDDFDYSMAEIARQAGVGYATLKLFWPTLLRQQIVAHVRTVGKAKMYRLNTQSTHVQQFLTFYWGVVRKQNRRAALLAQTKSVK
jgi:hypothetical protein